MKYIISIAIFMFVSSFAGVRAQNDPTLAGMILMYTNKAEKELKNQEKVMLLQSTGHIWTKEEVEATTDLQRGVQQLSGFLPFHRQLCRTDIRFLSRDRSVGGQHGRISGSIRCPSSQRTCRSPVCQAQQDIPRADYEQHRDCE